MSQWICKDLVIGYEGNAIIEGLNFTIEEADYICILGENGSGKSTLLKTILGLIPQISGTFQVPSKKKIGYVPQQTSAQKDFPASVEEIVQSGCLPRCGLRPFYHAKEKQYAKDAMEKLGITSLAKRCYRELSGGQQERVLLARALCTECKMLFLDEPTSGLDAKITEEMYQLLKKLNEEEKVTIVMISHDLSASYQYANKILYLGKDVFWGTKEEYIKWKSEKGELVL